VLAAFDIDGTLDANPPLYLSIMQALRMAGHRVVVVTGCSCPKVEPQDIIDKTEYLANLGLGECYDQLVVLADPAPENKAEWLAVNKADLLVDNTVANVKAAPGSCLCLVPWATRIKDK
jgi:hypothetical protein